MAVKPIPEGHHTITPHLYIKNAPEAIEFYKKAFGAKEISRAPGPDGKIMHAELKIGDSLVMLGQASLEWRALPAALYVWVPDVDAVYTRALEAGATSQSAPEDKPYGHRNAGVVDRNGVTWWIGSPVG